MTFIIGLAVMQGAVAQDYAVFALPAGIPSSGWKVNSLGEIAGEAPSGGKIFHAARWTYDAGWTLDLLDVETRSFSHAYDINDL